MKKISLAELMGKAGSGAKKKKLTLEDLSDLLGERMPKLEFHPVGRLRLMTALRQRFGDNWKHLPGIQDIIKEFDREASFNVKKEEMKMIRAAGKKE